MRTHRTHTAPQTPRRLSRWSPRWLPLGPLLPSLLLLWSLAFIPAPAAAQRLAELCQAAVQGSPFLKLRELEVERAQAERDGVRSKLLPQVGAQASWSRNDYRDAQVDGIQYDGKRFGLTARMALLDTASGRQLAGASLVVLQREQEAAHTRASLVQEVVDVYLKGLQALDELATLDAEAEASRRQVQRLQAMREREMAKVTDLAEAQAYAQSLVTRRIDAQNQLEQALARLAELAGQPVLRLAPLAREAFEPVAGSAEAATEVALGRHPRLLALEHGLQAAQRAVEAAQAQHLPQLAVVASHVYTDQGFDNRRQPPYHASSLGLELRIPLYEGGRASAGVRESLARLQISQQQLDAARREISRETRTSFSTAQANHLRIDSTLQEVAALELTVRAQERGVELGVVHVVDLLDARRRLVKARGDHARARYDFVRSVVDLRSRGGDLSDDDVAGWDRWFGPL